MEIGEILRFSLALGFVLGLVALCSWLAKRMGLAPRVSGNNGSERLGVIEIKALDAKRKLVLVRRDNVEHLLLLNGERDLLIEQGISGVLARGDSSRTCEPANIQRLHSITGIDVS